MGVGEIFGVLEGILVQVGNEKRVAVGIFVLVGVVVTVGEMVGDPGIGVCEGGRGVPLLPGVIVNSVLADGSREVVVSSPGSGSVVARVSAVEDAGVSAPETKFWQPVTQKRKRTPITPQISKSRCLGKAPPVILWFNLLRNF